MAFDIVRDHILVVGASGVPQVCVKAQRMASARDALLVHQANHFKLEGLILDAEIGLGVTRWPLCVQCRGTGLQRDDKCHDNPYQPQGC